MITTDTFFSSTLNTVDAVIGNFVQTAYTHFVQANAALITLLFTVYVMFLGYQFLTHSQQFNLSTVAKHIVVMLCIYGMVMNWQWYHLFVYQIFTVEPGNIAHILVTSTSTHTAGSIAHTLDDIYAAVIKATMGLFAQINFSAAGFAFIFYAGLVFIVGSLMCVFALLLFIYAKMMMAVTLALGPIFILFILWDATKGLFSAWLNKLITLALIPIITSAILVLLLSVVMVTLPAINQPVESQQFYGIAPFLGLCLATTLILIQVFRICSALGGGMTLMSISAGGAIASAALKYSGISSATKWAKDKVMQPRSRRQ